MSDNSPSKKFLSIYDSLPPEVQRTVAGQYLSALLDNVPPSKSDNIITSLTRVQTRYTALPILDLRSKRREIDALLEEYNNDTKVNFLKERSRSNELLEEVIDSLTNWLNDIWSVVYEYGVNFELAHSCLLYVVEMLVRVAQSLEQGSCKCSILNLPFTIKIKSKAGKCIKKFKFRGPHNLDQVLLWIWRELFVSYFAKAGKAARKNVPEMLDDIEQNLGWNSLARLIYGGRRPDEDDDEDDEDYDEDLDDLDWSDDDDYDYDDEHDSVYSTEEEDVTCDCRFHAFHWPPSLHKERKALLKSVLDRLFALYEIRPSIRMHDTIVTLSDDANSLTESKLHAILARIAGSTSNTFIAALDIYIYQGNITKIASTLETHYHLFRPKDSITHQCCLALMSSLPRFQARATALYEKELIASLQNIHGALLVSFSRSQKPLFKLQMLEILNLPAGSTERQERIGAWVDSIITSSDGGMHPFAMAALMMGFPMMPGMEEGEDADVLGFMELDEGDDDLEELREEFRPRLRSRWESWCRLGGDMKGGAAILGRVHAKALEMMPFLKAPDIVEVMVSRLKDRTSRQHVGQGLEALALFCKAQAKKQDRAKQREAKAKGKAAAKAKGADAKSSSKSAASTPAATPLASNTRSSPEPSSLGDVD